MLLTTDRRIRYQQNLRVTRRGWHDEEVRGRDLPDVIPEECPPRLRWRLAMADDVLRDVSDEVISRNLPIRNNDRRAYA